jgi:hypothetical protein
MGAEPVLAVYAGYSLSGDHIDAGPLLKPYVDDALDEIEYVIGDTSTYWGAKRAADGILNPSSLPTLKLAMRIGSTGRTVTMEGLTSSEQLLKKIPATGLHFYHCRCAVPADKSYFG